MLTSSEIGWLRQDKVEAIKLLKVRRQAAIKRLIADDDSRKARPKRGMGLLA
jgi:hypothetical protein